jgi:hypothetical protein
MTAAPTKLSQWTATVPRPVRRRPATYFTIIGLRLVLGPFILLGIAAAGVIAVSVAWLAFGTDRQAEVTNTWITHWSRSKDIYNVAYRCQVGGTSIIGQIDVQKSEFEEDTQTLTARAAHISVAIAPPLLRVRTLGIPPLVYAVPLADGDSEWEHAAAIWVWALVLMALARGAYYLAFQVPARQKALYRDGEASLGTIVQKCQRTSGKSVAFSLLYEFKSSDGYRQTADQHVYRPAWVLAEIDQHVLVMYDSDDPEQSVLYDYGDFMAVESAGR